MNSVKAALLSCALMYCIVLSTTEPKFKQCPDSPDPLNGEDVRLTQPNCTDDPCTINVKDQGNTVNIDGRWKFTTPDYKVFGGSLLFHIYLYARDVSPYYTVANVYKGYDEDGNEIIITNGGFPKNTTLDLDLWNNFNYKVHSGEGNLTLKLEVKPYEQDKEDVKDKKKYLYCVYTDVKLK